MVRLYLDTAPIIYHIERTAPLALAVDARLADPGVVLVSSELARLECLVVPLKNGDLARVGDFDMFFQARVAELVDFTGAVFRRAAEIRRRTDSKLPTRFTWPPPSSAAARRS